MEKRVADKSPDKTNWAVPNSVLPSMRSESASRAAGKSGPADSFLRTLKRHSLRVRRSRSLAVTEKRKSDSFVNSQEWTLCRSVPDLRVGIVGSLSSCKSALVHRYLTGSYMQEESPEGGRFKKEVVIDGQSHLLLIRDEGGLPEYQFATWVDAVIFVFSLENESSFNAIYSYYTKLSHYRNYSEIPMILVGTQDAINETNPRVIDDAKARRLAADLKRCPYYETCATYGLNVDRVFQDICQKIVQQRISSLSCLSTPSDSRPTTPSTPNPSPIILSHYNNNHNWHLSNCSSPNVMLSPPTPSFAAAASPNSPNHCPTQPLSYNNKESSLLSASRNDLSCSNSNLNKHPNLTIAIDNSVNGKHIDNLPKDLPTPTSTPTAARKFRRRSNLFMTSSKKGEEKLKNGELGSGRAIPLKQGYLYKKTGKTLNKEWKKKYVTLCDDGRLTYHPSLHDYMEDVHGKEILLQYVTVKIPGQKPRGSKTVASNNASNDFLNSSISNMQSKDKKNDKVLLTAFEVFKDSNSKVAPISEDSIMILSNSSLTFANGNTENKIETPNVKKRHRRLKSASVKNQECDDSDCYEFHIVSLNNKQWQFEATSHEDRNEWITAIEQQILSSLQGIEISKGKSRLHSSVEAASLQSIRSCVPGNTICADCGSLNPDWASMNLGILVCIECSGIHRNLGSHISKIRSLNLDEWPQENLSVMLSIGNTLANSVWENNVPKDRNKPRVNSKREEKEQWIRSKYELKEFLAPVPSGAPLWQQLVDAVYKNDMRMVVLLLAHATPEDINTVIIQREHRTPLHVACALGSLPIAQLLIWNSADTKVTDYEGRTCLSYVNNAIRTQYDSSGNINALKNLLISCGCSDTSGTAVTNGTGTVSSSYSSNSSSSTLSRQKSNNHLPPLDKLPSSII